tara:strand:- start:50083 stop:50532 length:450 start_codon:yes stop_codon:yes gene_type:complete
MIHQINEVKLSYQGSFLTSHQTVIKHSSDAAKLCFQSYDHNTITLQETFKILLLNNANGVKGMYTHSIGGMTGTLVDLRILFGVILKSLTPAIILCHNHPSGQLKASTADKEITSKIVNAGAFLDVKVLDHIILSPTGSYFSFTDEGIL